MPFSDAFKHAMNILDDLNKSGYAVVPAKPTKAMIAAGVDCSGISEDVVEKIYRAMIHAASKH